MLEMNKDRYFKEFKYRDFGIFGPKRWDRLEEEYQDDFASKHNYTDVAMTLQRYKNPIYKKVEEFIAPIWFDIDSADQSRIEIALRETNEVIQYFLQEFDLHNEHLRIHFSGRKGFHILVPEEVLGITPHPQLNKVHRRIADNMTETLKLTCIDRHSFDRRRLVRIPNTRHSGTGLYKVELYVQELKDIDEIRKLAQKPRNLSHSDPLELQLLAAERYTEIKREVLGKEPKYSINHAEIRYPCIRKIFIDGPLKLGIRHDCTMVLAVCFKKDLKLPELETLKILLKWNKEHFEMSREENFSAVEDNVKSQIRSVYKNEYRIGCKESVHANLLKEHCDPLNCSFHNCNKGKIYIEREQRYSYIWNKNDGMGPSCQRVYEAMVDWCNRNQDASNPKYEEKKTFFVSGPKLGNLSNLSSNSAKLALEKLIAVGLIERVPQIKLPLQYQRKPGRRTCDYYIIPNWNKEIVRSALEKWKKIKEGIYGKFTITKLREISDLPKSTISYLKDTIQKLLENKGEFTVDDLKRERISENVMKRYLNDVISKSKNIFIKDDNRGKRIYYSR